jgi:hypothetical protein
VTPMSESLGAITVAGGDRDFRSPPFPWSTLTAHLHLRQQLAGPDLRVHADIGGVHEPSDHAVAWKGGTMTDGVPLALVESAKMPPGYIQFLLKTDFVLSGAGELARGYKF